MFAFNAILGHLACYGDLQKDFLESFWDIA